MEASKPMSRPIPQRWQTLAERTLALSVLAILLLYDFALFVQLPYRNFNWDSSTGRVVQVYVEAGLQPEDRIIQIGSMLTSNFQADLRLTVLNDTRPGQVVPLVIQRGDQQLTIPWTMPGFNQEEFLQGRLKSQWWLALVFWGVGELTLLSVRPRGTRRQLLAVFSFLIALWLGVSIVSGWHMWESAIALRMVTWLLVPVSWQLHWVFPQPLKRLPIWVWPGLHLAGVALAGAEWFQILPRRAYILGFILMVAGSIILLAAHFIFRPAQRKDLVILLAAGALTFLPLLALGIMAALRLPITSSEAAVLLFLPILPLGYFYVAYRRQLGGMELRANRFISIYIFVILLALASIIVDNLANRLLHFEGQDILIDFGLTLLVVGAALFGFAPFQRFVERRLLGMPLPTPRLVETYANRIVAALDAPGLVRLLTDKVLPSLLVRQFVFLGFDEAGRGTALCALGIEPDQLPGDREVPALLAGAGQYRLPGLAEGAPEALAWVRLVLPLYVGGSHPIGLWLLGRRDPDDLYAQAEIPTLQALANQTAVALSHIRQTERLRALHQASIDRHETERTNLAHELHDEVLNQLAAMNMIMDMHGPGLRFHKAYGSLTQRIRQTIRVLRPAMLSYGLRPALDQLADELAERAGGAVRVSVEVEASEARYAPQMEQHLYRIVQQACENALKHGRPQVIRISGQLEAGQIELTVEDDGVGFAAGAPLDLTHLLAHNHFGLAGMYERAALIHARMELDSEPGRGTHVRLTWMADDHVD